MSKCVLGNSTDIVFLSLPNRQWTVGVCEELLRRGKVGEHGVNVRVHKSQRWKWLEYRSGWERGCLLMRLFNRFQKGIEGL